MRARTREAEEDDLGHVLCGHHPREHVGSPAIALLEREVGRDAARTDVRAADAMLAQLVVERAREPDLTELGRAVDGFAGKPAAPGLRRERDEVALTARDQVRDRRTCRVDRPL